ncbi:hypothetical protein ACFPIF_15465 [Brevundimonas faecalis]|uniref:hypothetical protein n=1 Tax=Brevundimonas faecalis TaxID=947378 RepID=UPI00361560BA
MKLPVLTEIVSLKGEAVIDPFSIPKDEAGRPAGPGKPLILREVIAHALLMPQSGDEALSGKQKLEDFNIAAAAYDSDMPDYDLEELSRIKARVGSFWGASIVGRVFPMLDPA